MIVIIGNLINGNDWRGTMSLSVFMLFTLWNEHVHNSFNIQSGQRFKVHVFQNDYDYYLFGSFADPLKSAFWNQLTLFMKTKKRAWIDCLTAKTVFWGALRKFRKRGWKTILRGREQLSKWVQHGILKSQGWWYFRWFVRRFPRIILGMSLGLLFGSSSLTERSLKVSSSVYKAALGISPPLAPPAGSQLGLRQVSSGLPRCLPPVPSDFHFFNFLRNSMFNFLQT